MTKIKYSYTKKAPVKGAFQLYSKPLACVAAFLAEGFGDVFVLEGTSERFGAGGTEDIAEVIGEDIAEGYNSVGVKAAGYDASVAEDAHLIAQTVAGMSRSDVFAVGIRPIEKLAPFKEDLILYFISRIDLFPFITEKFAHFGKDIAVLRFPTALVPKAEHRDLSPLGGLCCKIEALREVFVKGKSHRIDLVAMERNADLVQCRSVEQDRRFFIEQGSVGCQDDLESELASDPEKAFKLGVKKRFAHQVEVEVFGKRTDLSRRRTEFPDRYKALLPARSVTEGAGQIAYVGYFKKGFFEHTPDHLPRMRSN